MSRLRCFETAAKGSRALGYAFPHTLLSGPGGTGKTTLAERLAQALGGRAVRTAGPLLQDTHALLRQLAQLGEHDVLFLDEIHAVSRQVLELLYEAMEERRASLTLHAGALSRSVRLELPHFTLLAATTDEERLPDSLLGRFGLHEILEVTPEAAAGVVGLSRGVPRDLGYSAAGLKPIEQRTLAELRESSEAIPLERLARTLGVSAVTLTRRVEPFLVREGHVRITSRGRTLVGRPRLVEASQGAGPHPPVPAWRRRLHGHGSP